MYVKFSGTTASSSKLTFSRSEEVLNNGDSSSSGTATLSKSESNSVPVDVTPSKPENTSISADKLLDTFTLMHADEDRLFRAHFEVSCFAWLNKNYPYPEELDQNQEEVYFYGSGSWKRCKGTASTLAILIKR